MTDTQTSLMPLSRESVQAISANEPEWMRQRRAEAWRLYLDTPFPDSSKDEGWRRTNIRSLLRRLDKLTHAPQALLADSIEALPEAIQQVLRESDKRGGLMVRRDNSVVYHELDEEYAEQGVRFLDLGQALRDCPELVEGALGTLVRADEGKFEAQHTALMQGGIFLHVPEGVLVERTLQVIHWVDSSDVMLYPHTLATVGEGAQATLLEEYQSPDGEGTVFVNSAVELSVGDNAALIYLGVQSWGANVTHLSVCRSQVGRNGNLNLSIGQFGAKLSRFQTEAEMVGQGGTALLNGVFFPTEGQQHGNYTLQHHKATHCTSDLLFKGALLDDGRSVYEGGIKVAKGAQQTDAYQANRNLMLSRKAHADSIPQLEIEAHEVRCTHGSTTSQMDQEELFYLMSRGIPREPATHLVVEGFFVPVLDRIPLREVRNRLKAAIQAKLER